MVEDRSKIRSAAGSASGAGRAEANAGMIARDVPSKPSHPLDRAFARVNRAEEHLAELVRHIAIRGKKQVEAFRFEPNPQEPKKIVMNRGQPLSIEPIFGILIGEICYNLRAALDYLIYELAILDSKHIHERTQFPIEDKQKKFAWWIDNRLMGLNSAHVAAIERLQPYKGCQWTAALRDISNPDKHRSLMSVQALYEVTVHVVDREHLGDFADMPGAIRSAVTADGTEMYVKLQLATSIQFADGAPVVEPLDVIKFQVAETLKAFKPEFQ